MKKTWNSPAIEAVNLGDTAHDWIGFCPDGGYIGDGQISGHLDKDSDWWDPFLGNCSCGS